MITGLVVPHKNGGLEIIVNVLVRGPNGKESSEEAVLDTGFNGFLTLSRETISNLALPYISSVLGIQADGSRVTMDVFKATILWDNQERSIEVLASEGGALIGISMLVDYHVMLGVKDGESIIMEALS